MKWYLKCLKQYADFSGRARRKEFWIFTLPNNLLFNLLYLWLEYVSDDFITDDSNFAYIVLFLLLSFYSFIVIIPGLAVSVRRLHDTSHSGWWLLLSLVPVANIVLLSFYVCDSTPGANEYGENPKGC